MKKNKKTEQDLPTKPAITSNGVLGDVCSGCGGETENDGEACKGACTSERYYGNDLVDLDTKGLPSCNCCEACRWKCHESFMQSVEDGEQG
jgi:hypothetical protein